MDRVPVSIVIPAYNEALRLPASIPRLLTVMTKIPGSEIIVVDDGSTDGTAAVAEELLYGYPNYRVLRLPWNSGKGTAVRAGVAAARGQSIVFMDADGASDVNDLPLLLAALEHAEVALGSRRIGDGAVRTSGRRMGSWAFNQITRSLTDLDVADTQCGFKAFRHAEAKILFSLARSTGFGFDVEVLSIARSIGYRIAEVPVRWSETPGGTFRVTRHTPAMLIDVMRARRYLNRVGPVPPIGRTRRVEVPRPAQTPELVGRVNPNPAPGAADRAGGRERSANPTAQAGTQVPAPAVPARPLPAPSIAPLPPGSGTSNGSTPAASACVAAGPTDKKPDVVGLTGQPGAPPVGRKVV